MQERDIADGVEQDLAELCKAIASLPEGCQHLLLTFYVALRSMHQLSKEEHVNGSRAWLASRAVAATSPLVGRFLEALTFAPDLADADLTQETWEWITRLKLRGLGLQQQGLALLHRSMPPGPAWNQLAALSVATGDIAALNGVLPHLAALRHLAVHLEGAGTYFPRLPRRLASLSIHCSNTASLHTLLSLCQADRVVVAADEDIVWNTSMRRGLQGVPWAGELLEVAQGRFGSGQQPSRLRLLVPSGFNRMFGSMQLSEAITSAGTLNCYAAAVAAQLAPLQPVELTLRAGQTLRFQDLDGPLPNSSLNFAPALPRSAAVWEGLWEAAAELAGLQLSSRYESLPASGAGGASEVINATVYKVSPAMAWPQPVVSQAAAGGGGAAEAGGRHGDAAEKQREPSCRRPEERGSLGLVLLGLLEAGLLMAAGALLSRLLQARKAR